jgi:hypothetical protein
MKQKTPIKRFKTINCKWEEKGIICNKPCLSGKRSFCDRHYAIFIKQKEKEKAKILKVKESKLAKRIKKRETITGTKLWTLTSQLTRKIKPLICCTCDKELTYETAQAGHFRSRRFGSTKYDLRNLNPQCKSCNVFYGGFEYEHGLFIIKNYGQDTLNLMVNRSRDHSFKISKSFINSVYILYKEHLKILDESPTDDVYKSILLKSLVSAYESIYLENKT